MNFEKNKTGNALSRNLQVCKPNKQADSDRNYSEQMLKQLLRKKRDELKLPKMPSQQQEVQLSIQSEMLLDEVCSALSFCSKIVSVCNNGACEVQLNSLSAYLKDSDNESERFFSSNRYQSAHADRTDSNTWKKGSRKSRSGGRPWSRKSRPQRWT